MWLRVRTRGRLQRTGTDVDSSNELQLADALTRLALALLNETSLKADLERLAGITCGLIPNCSGASVSMVVDGEPTTVAVTDHVALQLDLVQYASEDGPCIAALGGEAVRIGFIPANERFPQFAAGAADRRVLSVLSTPAIDHGTVVGSLNVYSRVEEAFDERDRQTAQLMAGEIAHALIKSAILTTAVEVRDQLQEVHDTTVMMAQATGVLMAFQDCSSAQAAELIRTAAEENKEPMIRTAERIVSTVESGKLASTDRPAPAAE
jgi:hypothetical protein